jgi:nicotinate-nucleotide--dimethylbenzimidazole phosphoribosyltransferase
MTEKYTQAIVDPVDEGLRKRIQAKLDDLTKPPGSLGVLEDLVMQYCLCRDDENSDISSMKIFTFAGDHGITAEKITPYPSEVTAQMVENMARGGAAISVMCRAAGIGYTVVDMGVASDLSDLEGLVKRKVAPGTESFLKSSAMTEKQCLQALDAGRDLALEAEGELFGIGEMGIGNTSSASALYSLILDLPAAETVGAGTGSTGELFEKKVRVIGEALDFHRKEWDGSGFDALKRLGGFELAGMAGFIFGAAERRVPVVVDGFISSAAALVALEMEPKVKPYLIFSHASAEKFHHEFLRRLKLHPVMDLKLRLGEGTGSALAMQIVKQALNCYHTMATFSSAGVSNAE